jgi:hypothetical protein
MQVRVKTIVFLIAISVVGVSAVAQSNQAAVSPSPTSSKAAGGKPATKPAQDGILHDGLSPKTVNQAEKRKPVLPAAMRSVPVEIKEESNCHSSAGDA